MSRVDGAPAAGRGGQRWRVGRSVGRTVYRDDVLVGLMDTPELAEQVVRALNRLEQTSRDGGGAA